MWEGLMYYNNCNYNRQQFVTISQHSLQDATDKNNKELLDISTGRFGICYVCFDTVPSFCTNL